MRPPRAAPEPAAPESSSGSDPDLEAALKRVLQVIFREHPLGANQILHLAAELQKLGVHRLVEEHLQKFRRRESAD